MVNYEEADLIRWKYNCLDVDYTLEIEQVLQELLDQQPIELYRLYRFLIEELSPAAVKTMNRGVRIDVKRKQELYAFFSNLIEEVKAKIDDCLGFQFNLNSTPQKKKVFADFLGVKIKVRKGKETCDAAAMLEYIEDYPEYRPFLTLLLEHASLKVFTNNFLGMQLDDDDRARTQYGVSATNTGRLNSKKNVWGKGGNFQNIPEKGKIPLRYALQVLEDSNPEEANDYYSDIEDRILSELTVEGSIRLPNVKKIFLPDVGMEIADLDYSGADIMVVAADSECKWLLDFFANPKGKVYKYIASEFFQREITDEEYKTFKAIFHGTNYLMGIDKLALMAGIPYPLAMKLQNFYFKLNPEIKVWQERVRYDVATHGYVTNIFGRRAWFVNKNDPMLINKAVAFKPQSTIADLVNRAWCNVIKELVDAGVLLQVHDSLVVQYPIEEALFYREQLIQKMQIALPFKQPLIIPADIKVSTISYGDTKKVKNSDAREFNIVEKRLIAEVI